MALGDRRQKKDIEATLKRAERAGLKVTHDKNRHRWGWVLCCPCNASFIVYCTPKNAGNEARDIEQFTRKHANCA
ncbi:hypothetical protein ACSMX9_16505 [Streptomyces sp. LE64]|uniref:hypothetical protein n=1 Tax=Streptomyces sp. LE64 TaxID=3448653 RepID=UPI004040F124